MKFYATAFGVVSVLPRSMWLLARCNGIDFEEFLLSRGLYEYQKQITGAK
jgi:hypothetical protein